MINRNLYYQIKAKNEQGNREHQPTIGVFTWEQYRELKQIWHRVPNEKEYDTYFFWCKINSYDPEHIEQIKARYNRL